MLKLFTFSVILLCFSLPAVSQNTKGDKPVKNQRQVRETRAKSVKKKERGTKTRDIANRRLRTKGTSSANRANSNYPRTSPYKVSKSQEDRSARPTGRVFSQSPRETRTKAWRGDVSGYKIRKVKPTGADAARTNVYPQKGPYVRYARKQPKKRPPVYSRTIKGNKFVTHKPRYQERAWKGGVDQGPIKNQSATGSIRNTYSQKGPYVAYYRKNTNYKQKSISNGRQLAQLKKLQRPRTGGSQGSIFPASVTRIFVQRGKKNVYWGKVQKKEKGYIGDITGGPLRTRNFRTQPPGLHGRDTLKFFGKKPFGDRRTGLSGGGYQSASGKGKGSWKGDIAGWRLRKSVKGKKEVAGKFIFPRKLSISSGGQVGRPIPGSGGFGGLLSGKGKGKKPSVGGGSITGQGWNNNRRPIGVRTPGYGSIRGARFSGNLPQGGAGFSRAGAGYSGNIKRSSIRGFNLDGVGTSGNIKRSSIRGFNLDGVGSSGNIKRSSIRGFSTDGAGYSGNMKRWQQTVMLRNGANYQGRLKRGGGVFDNVGVGFSGNIKSKRPDKGGGSVSGRVWNNNNHAIQTRVPLSKQGGDYSGNIKFKRPEKGGGSVSGKLWNNNNQAIQTRVPLSKQGGDYSGNIKFKRPEKGGGSVSGKLMNNNGQPILVRTPKSDDANYSGKIPLSRFKKNYVQNPNASKESIKKQRPDATTYRVAGLQVKVKQGDYQKKPNASKLALPGVAPTKSSVKASEYARSIKQYWDYKHNPNSASGALKVRAPGKAYARIGDFQGNVKMHKYNDRRLHPDAQFAHGFRDNVKEERTLLMNVKLMWGKLFRKSETQPENLKDKIQKPKYDKREKGLWND